MSLDGTFVRFKSTMKYRRLFAFMHSVTCSFHFKFAEIANFNSVTYQQFLPTDNYTREIMKVLLKVYDYLFSFVCVQLHSVLLGPLSRPRNPRSFWPVAGQKDHGLLGRECSDHTSTAEEAFCTLPTESQSTFWAIVVSSMYLHVRASTIKSLIISRNNHNNLGPLGHPSWDGAPL